MQAKPRPQKRASIVLFTCGYEGRNLDELLRELVARGVQLVIDVRARAASRKSGFNKTSLKDGAEHADLRYYHMPTLGVPSEKRRDPSRRRQVLDWYDLQLERRPPDELNTVAELATTAPSVLLCYEAEPDDCHRSLLAMHLSRRLNCRVVNL